MLQGRTIPRTNVLPSLQNVSSEQLVIYIVAWRLALLFLHTTLRSCIRPSPALSGIVTCMPGMLAGAVRQCVTDTVQSLRLLESYSKVLLKERACYLPLLHETESKYPFILGVFTSWPYRAEYRFMTVHTHCNFRSLFHWETRPVIP